MKERFFFRQGPGIYNFADGTMYFICEQAPQTVLETLERNSEKAIFRFEDDYMKLNTNKCHLQISRLKYQEMWEEIGEDRIWESSNVKLLLVTTDIKLNFDSHIIGICLKANQKLVYLVDWLSSSLLIKNEYILKHFLNLSLNIVLWYERSVVEIG